MRSSPLPDLGILLLMTSYSLSRSRLRRLRRSCVRVWVNDVCGMANSHMQAFWNHVGFAYWNMFDVIVVRWKIVYSAQIACKWKSIVISTPCHKRLRIHMMQNAIIAQLINRSWFDIGERSLLCKKNVNIRVRMMCVVILWLASLNISSRIPIMPLDIMFFERGNYCTEDCN